MPHTHECPALVSGEKLLGKLFSVLNALALAHLKEHYKTQPPPSFPGTAGTDSEERPQLSKLLFVPQSGLVPRKLGAGAKVRRQTEAVREASYFQLIALCLLLLLLSFKSTASPNSTRSSSNTPTYAPFSPPASPGEQLTVGGFVAIRPNRDCLAQHCSFNTTRFWSLFELFLPHLLTPPSEH